MNKDATTTVPDVQPDGECTPADSIDVKTASVTWTISTTQVTARHRRTALFRKTPQGWTLQHIRGVHLRQRGPTESYLDNDATLADVPDEAIQRAGVDISDQTAVCGGGVHA